MAIMTTVIGITFLALELLGVFILSAVSPNWFLAFKTPKIINITQKLLDSQTNLVVFLLF